MAALRCVFIFLCCGFFVNSEVNTENTSNSLQTRNTEIAAVLDYLNSAPVKVYSYKHGTLINAHTKADITELALHVSVDCISNYPDLPCSEKVLICNAFVQNNQVLGDVKCQPKPEIIVEEPSYVTNSTEVEANENKSIALSNEAVSSEVGEHFVAVRRDSVLCLGCPFDLNPDAEGVNELIDTALRHVETEKNNKQALVKVLKLQQQVVSGVKYIILIEIAPTVCSKETVDQAACAVDETAETNVCEVTYLQKPWISRAKHVISNNCTVSQEFVQSDCKKDINNEIDVNSGPTKPAFVDGPNFDRIAESGAVDDMTPSRLENLESQIIVEPEVTNPPSRESDRIIDEFIVPSTVQSEFSAIGGQPLEDKPTLHNTDSSQTVVETTPSNEQQVANDFVMAYYGSVDSSDFPQQLKNGSKESRSKRAVPQLEKITPEEKGLVKNLADFAASTLDNMDDDNHKRVILQILGAKKMVGDDGVYYRLIMRMGISKCLEDAPPNPNQDCREKLFENYTKICKVQVYVNDDFGSPKVVKSQCQNIKRDQNDSNRTNYSRFRRDVFVGGQSSINKDSEKIRELVHDGVDRLNAQWDENKHKPVEVVGATSQIVSGILYRVKIKLSPTDCSNNDAKDLEDCQLLQGAPSKTCTLKIWEKPWMDFRQFTVTCDGDDKVYKFGSGVEERVKRQMVGGLSKLPKDDKTVVTLLEDSLQCLDSVSSHENKLKVHEVIDATSQTVSGFIYRIKAKIVESDCKISKGGYRGKCGSRNGAQSKVCTFEIWEREWIPDERETKINCENDDKQYFFKGKHHVRTARQITGGITETSKNNEYVVQYLEEALQHLDTVTPHENKLKVQEIVSASEQVVAGALYRIKAKIIQADCKKSSATARGDCATLRNAQPKTCDFKIWDRPWIPNSRQTNITCENSEFHSFQGEPRRRTKRQTRGGIAEASKDAPKVLEYLEESLQHLDTVTPHENKLKVQEVTSASKQVVAGVLYRITAKVVQADCKKSSGTARTECGTLRGSETKTCSFRIWDRVWKPDSRNTNVTCDDEEYFFKGVPKQKRSSEDFKGPRLLGRDDMTSHFLMFNDFIKTFNKTYASKKEYKYRLKVFSDNMQMVRVLNTYEQGTAKYGVTQFADMTRTEFSKSLGYRPDLRVENEVPFGKAQIPDVELPTEFDWREKGAVTEVKNQEQCGSCWAFSVTGNVEGQYAIKHGKLMEFSEQELVDCDTDDQGCNGGLMDNAYRAIEKMGGLESEQDYPYDAEDEKCHFNRTLARVQLTGAVNISHDETEMAKWLVANGPISIAINANAMQFYMGGVSHPFKFLCSPNSLDHGVLIVGYGVHTYPLFKKSLPYWIVKNSWGKSWGEQGYYRVYRGDGTCGLNQTPSSAIVA